jgi:hypothetical protein
MFSHLFEELDGLWSNQELTLEVSTGASIIFRVLACAVYSS